MKRFFAFVAAAALVLGCSEDRSNILKIYNWSEYIDDDLVAEFEEWYEAETGKKVKVVYQTFDINETMLSKIEKGHEDFDVVCPSDYIIERMLRSDLLLPIDRDFGSTPDYIDENLSPWVRYCFNKIDGGGKDANDYSVGYMWGAHGILYNTKYVTREEASSWEILRNPKFKDKIFIKDSARDVFSQIIIHLRQDQLASGEVTLDELMLDSSDEAIADVEAFLKDVKPLVLGWEADFGKDQMAAERGWVSLNWSGEGVWARAEGAKVGVDIDFAYPKEGFTVWFDGWVIPKYARNVDAARYWINFMCRPDNVIRNMAITGYASVIGAPEVLEAFLDDEFGPTDVSYFFGPEADSVYVNPSLYPDRKDIERSTMEHDWGDRTPALLDMWSRVKGDNATVLTAVVVSLFVLAIAGFVIFSHVSKKHKHRGRKSHK